MSKLEIGGTIYEVDEEGFLQEPERWNQEVARDFARTEAITLTDKHWTIIHYIRNYYMQFGITPMICKVCRETGHKLKEIFKLFPSGLARGACKLAGLPKPTGCV